MRLFVAVWPPPEVIDLIADLPRPEVRGLRWAARPHWHVTIRFLGNVTEVDQVAEALSVLSGSDRASAVLGPATAWFPGRRVLQIPVAGLEDLGRRVNAALAPLDALLPASAKPDEPFNGHLTVARVRGKGRIHSAEASKVEGKEIEAAWEVQRFSLMASSLGSEGPTYSDVSTVPLGT